MRKMNFNLFLHNKIGSLKKKNNNKLKNTKDK